MLRRLFLLSMLTAGSVSAQPNVIADADTSGPRSAVGRFLALNAASRLQSEEGKALLGGEVDDVETATVGPLPAPDRIVRLAGGSAVARLPAEGEDGQDLYLYLEQNGDRWAIDAVRSLALTGVPRELRRLLRAQPSRTAEQEKTLREVDLTLSSDRQLTQWFEAHQEQLERLRDLAAGGVEQAATQALVRELDCTNISLSREGVTTLTIGGMVDNGVGFLHSEDPARVPPIDSHDHIWVESLGDGWYLFRTT